MLVLVAPHAPLGADESLYASQVNPHTPALHFSAPRARGVTYLIAPLLQVTDSTIALRAYLAVLAGLLLVAAYWPWLRVFRRRSTVPAAALLFCCLWTTLYYGASDMPNMWVAFGAVAAVGWFVRYGTERRPGALLGVAAGLAFTALMRPSDAVWISLPLLAAMLADRRWRRLPLAAAVLLGVAAGTAQWIVEAYQRFGGPTERLHKASLLQGGIGWHPAGILYELRALSGPLLCRPCRVDPTLDHARAWLLGAWWLAVPVVVLAGLVLARHERQLGAMAVPAAAGTCIGLSYLLTVDYAAPRFLLPSYGLLALPAAGLLTWLPGAVAPRLRPAIVGLLAVAVAALLTSQLPVLLQQADRPSATGRFAEALNDLGMKRPCMIGGVHRAQVAYRLGCTTATHTGSFGHARDTRSLAYLSQHPRPPALLAHWHRHRVAGPGHWYVYTPPDGWTTARQPVS